MLLSTPSPQGTPTLSMRFGLSAVAGIMPFPEGPEAGRVTEGKMHVARSG